MKLYLLRHAKASQNSGTLDIDRSLSGKGKEQVLSTVFYLSKKELPKVVWCSEANRTKETLSSLKETHSFKEIEYLPDFYLCSKDVFLKKIWNESEEEDILIVGHNFGLSDLANYFTGELLLMDTGEYICIDFGDLSLKESSKDTGTIIDRFIP